MNWRVFSLQAIVISIAVLLVSRLFYIQIIDDGYKRDAEKNVITKITQYPHRGLIFTEDDSLLVYNSPVYDLMVIPKEVTLPDTLAFAEAIGLTYEELKTALEKAVKHSPIHPSIVAPQLSQERFARLQDQLIEYPGFYALPRTIRSYNTNLLGNVLGYIGEVSQRDLEKDHTNYYKSGDYIGIGGLEKNYEETLRGQRGSTYKLVNVRGIVKDDYRDGKYDTLPQSGDNIYLTIDIELQNYAAKLMEGKVGSVVAIEPSSGKILALVSSPNFDPSLLSGKGLGKNFPDLLTTDNKPLINRPLQARYPPGSMFKTIQGLVALQDGVLQPGEIIFTDGTNIGDLAPPGKYSLENAIAFSSNNFFYLTMRRVVQHGDDPSAFIDSRIGLERWSNYINEFGIGKKLGIDLPNEYKGNVPDVDYYDRLYGAKRWKYSNIGSLSIGQGELLVTPLQMANLGAILANRGYYITPHIVSKINDWPNPNIQKNIVNIDTEYYEPVIEGMERVILYGSGRRAYMDSLFLCGKTSTVQNPHGEDHSGFMGFAPRNTPKIAVAAYVENAGPGSRAAAGTASLMVEKYIFGEVKRWWLEDYILEERYLPENAYRVTVEN